MKRFQCVVATLFILYAGMSDAGSPADHAVAIPDSLQSALKKSGAMNAAGQSDELVLEAIEIKGKIEKPGVYVMPRRIEPELEEMELGRSFQNELNDETRAIPKPENRLSEVEKVGSIRQAVERKRD